LRECVNDDPDRAMQPCQQSSTAELIEMLALAMYPTRRATKAS
jgi:hypothetical protein